MNFFKSTRIVKQAVLFFTFLQIPQFVFSQQADSTKPKISVNGAISVTNNGISVIPTFNLVKPGTTIGKPAIIFDLAVRKKRFSFEPQFRFAVEEFKPWSFVFWMRYKLLQTEKFKMGIGAHPSTVFGQTTALVNGVSKDFISVKRYWAGELSNSYSLSKNISFGAYYLYSRGLADATRNTNFVELGFNFSHIGLGGDYFFKMNPQIYYLQMDANTGYYATSSFTLAKQNFPFTISSVVNKKIRSSIPSKDFLWNVSLTYAY
jgi:hypothetical protein